MRRDYMVNPLEVPFYLQQINGKVLSALLTTIIPAEMYKQLTLLPMGMHAFNINLIST